MKLKPQFDCRPTRRSRSREAPNSSSRLFSRSPIPRFAAQPLPYGRTWRASGPAADVTAFRYQTKWSLDYGPKKGEHWAIDQYDYGLRMYDAQMGRFISRDPLGEAGGMNLYAAFGNDPINRYDYLGLYDDTLAKQSWIQEQENIQNCMDRQGIWVNGMCYDPHEDIYYHPPVRASDYNYQASLNQDRWDYWTFLHGDPNAMGGGAGGGNDGAGSPHTGPNGNGGGGGDPKDPKRQKEWSKADCDELKAQLGRSYDRFVEASAALDDALRFQYDSALTLYLVDRATDIGTSLFAGQVFTVAKSTYATRSAAQAATRLDPVLRGPGFIIEESTRSMAGKAIAYSAPAGLWAGEQVSGYVMSKPFAYGTNAVRNQTQNLVNDLESHVEGLSADLRGMRDTYMKHCF